MDALNQSVNWRFDPISDADFLRSIFADALDLIKAFRTLIINASFFRSVVKTALWKKRPPEEC